MANIIVNGNTVEITLPCKLSDWLQQSGWKPTQVVMELNGEVVPRSQLDNINILNGDRLEIIIPVAGG